MVCRQLDSDTTNAVFEGCSNALLAHLAKGLDSKKSAIRKSAFDTAFSLYQRGGSPWALSLYDASRKGSGGLRESVIRGMLERRLELG